MRNIFSFIPFNHFIAFFLRKEEFAFFCHIDKNCTNTKLIVLSFLLSCLIVCGTFWMSYEGMAMQLPQEQHCPVLLAFLMFYWTVHFPLLAQCLVCVKAVLPVYWFNFFFIIINFFFCKWVLLPVRVMLHVNNLTNTCDFFVLFCKQS